MLFDTVKYSGPAAGSNSVKRKPFISITLIQMTGQGESIVAPLRGRLGAGEASGGQLNLSLAVQYFPPNASIRNLGVGDDTNEKQI